MKRQQAGKRGECSELIEDDYNNTASITKRNFTRAGSVVE